MSLSKMGGNIKQIAGMASNLNPTLKITADVLKKIGISVIDKGRGMSR